MKTFNYKTLTGVEVELTIKEVSGNIIGYGVVNGIRFNSKCYFIYDNEGNVAIDTDIKIQGKSVNLYVTDEIKNYIKELKEKIKFNKMSNQDKIKYLESKKNFLYFVDADLVTGQRYYALNRRVDKHTWSKISKYFIYVNMSKHSDEFDAMYGSTYKGYVTNNPDKVQEILNKKLKDEIDKIDLKIKEVLGAN